MKIIKTYENFVNNRVNENWIGDKIRNIFSGLKKFFTGTIKDMAKIFYALFGEKAWKYNLLYMKQTGELDKLNIQYYPAKGDSETTQIKKNINDVVDYVNSNENYSLQLEKISHRSEDIGEDEFANLGGEEFGEELITGMAPDEVGVLNYTHDEVITMIKDAYNQRITTGKLCTFFIWGKSGIGKTQTVKRVADELGIEFLSWELATAEPTDLKGAVVPDMETKRTEYYVPKIFPGVGEKKSGIIFFDELNRAHPSVMNASINLLLAGKLDQYILPDNWLFVCAGNWPYDDSDIESKKSSKIKQAVHEMDIAARTRLTHVNLIMSARATLSYLKTKVDEDILDFLTFNKKYIHKSMGGTSMQYPNPRNWEQVSRFLQNINKTDPNRSLSNIKKNVAGFVGNKVADYFIDYLLLKHEVDLDTLKYAWTEPEKADRLDFSFIKDEDEDPGLSEGIDKLASLVGILIKLKPFDNIAENETNPDKLNYIKNIAKYIRSYDLSDKKLRKVVKVFNEYIPNLTKNKIWKEEMEKPVSKIGTGEPRVKRQIKK